MVPKCRKHNKYTICNIRRVVTWHWLRTFLNHHLNLASEVGYPRNLPAMLCFHNCAHRCRNKQIFGGAKDFCPIFSKLVQKVFVRLLPKNFFSHKDHEAILLMWSPKKAILQTLGAIFSRIFRDIAQIFNKSKLFVVLLHSLHHCLLHNCICEYSGCIYQYSSSEVPQGQMSQICSPSISLGNRFRVKYASSIL